MNGVFSGFVLSMLVIVKEECYNFPYVDFVSWPLLNVFRVPRVSWLSLQDLLERHNRSKQVWTDFLLPFLFVTFLFFLLPYCSS